MSSPSPVPAYLLWLGPTGLTIARALGREGVPVVALHHDPNEPSAGTRYARLKVLPPLDHDESAWLEFLLAEGRRLAPQKSVLFVSSDAHWLFVAKHRVALAEHFLFTLPDAPDICDWPSKPWQYQAALRAGIACPYSASPRDADDLHRLAAGMTYPCLIKPALSYQWLKHYPEKVAFARDERELLRRGEEALQRGLTFCVQEYIPAEDHDIFGMFSYLDRDSRPLGLCVSRKVRQHPPVFGSGSLSQTVHEPRVVELGLRLLKSIGFHGISSVEFKRDARDGEFKLMEINMRAPLMLGHAIDGGLNLPYIAYRDLIGDPLPAQGPRRLGRRVGLLQHDWYSARFYHRVGRLSWRAWLWQWLRTRDLYFAWDDMAPFRGYAHMLIDHWRRGKLRDMPPEYPSIEEWEAGRWDGRRKTASDDLRDEHRDEQRGGGGAPVQLSPPARGANGIAAGAAAARDAGAEKLTAAE